MQKVRRPARQLRGGRTWWAARSTSCARLPGRRDTSLPGADPISSVQSVPRHTGPMIRLGHRGVLAVLAVSLALAGCGSGHGLSPDPDSGPPVSAAPVRSLPRPAHVVVVISRTTPSSRS